MITVLRLGHRPERDKRITTHVCLTARAFGARRVLIAEEDERIAQTVRDVVKRFGGPFDIETGVGYRSILRNFPGKKVHLTMYGEALPAVAPRIDPGEDLLIVVGAEKVPGDVYHLVDHNVSVGAQPHSEVAALAILLYELQGPQVLEREFEGGELRVIPSAEGKRVEALPKGTDEAASGEDANRP